MWIVVGLNLWLLGMLVICMIDSGPWPLDEFLSLLAWPVTIPIAAIERRRRRKDYASLDDGDDENG